MPARILVVDDDESIRTLLALALAREGYDVDEAAEGGAALVRLGASPPDLVVLDMVMQPVSGWEFLASKVQIEGLADIPVIVISGYLTLPLPVAPCVKCVVEKPLILQDFFKLIEETLRGDS